MKRITNFYVLMLALLMSLGISAQQLTPQEYEVMHQKRIDAKQNAKQEPIDAQKIEAKGTTFTVPANGRMALVPINLKFTVDSYPSEASYNLWSVTDGAYYWASDQTFSTSGQSVTWILDLVEGQTYEVECYDTYGDGGIAGLVKNDNTGWTIVKWGTNDYSTYGVFPFVAGPGTPPPPPPTAITSFPASFNFNTCAAPAQFQLSAEDQAHAVINNRGVDNTCGIQLDGNSYPGWAYYSTPSDNWNYSPTHHARAWNNVTPSGQPGLLTLWFDFRMNYSFATYYNVFALTVNGVPIADKNGVIYQTPATASSDPWKTMEYNLAPYQNLPTVEVRFVNAGCYYYQYYQGGDATFIDNVLYFYKEVGTVEGYCTIEFGVPAVGAEVGFLGDDPIYPPQIVSPAGYYRYDLVPTTPNNVYDMYAYLDGQNYVEQTATLITAQTVQVNFNLSAPLMVISPVVLEETMNPNEWRSVPISIVNGGGGPLHWTAAIEFGAPPAATGTSTFLDITGNNFQPFTPTTGGELSFVSFENNDRGTDAIYCEEGSVWGNALVNPNNGYTSFNSAGYKCYQQFLGASGDFGFVTFWIVYTQAPSNPRDFQIEVYEANGNSVGALVTSTLANLEGFITGETAVGFAIWQYTAEIPVSDLENGFISVQGIGGSGTTYWANTLDPAATGVGIQNTTILPEKLAICLGGVSGGGWLDMSAYEGDVPANGGSGFVNALFDATGTVAGQVWTATINFTAEPGVSTTPVSVSMIIAGEPLMPVEEFTAELVNMVTGAVQLNWTAPANAPTFEYYLIRRNGQPIANTTNLSYVDILPTYGVYNYTLSAVYAEGESVPAGPEEVIWLIPVPCFTPDILNGQQLEGYVWTGTSEQVTMVIENCGEGVLAFDFTDFNDPEHSVGFVKAVHPYSGQIAEGESMEVTFTFSAVGVAAGTYNVNVPMTTNALAPLNEIDVPCHMIAYEPAIIQGHVEDCNSGMPLANVNVLASSIIGDFTAMTDASGNYMMYVEAYFSPWGAYYVMFQKLGYQDYYVYGVNTFVGTPTIVDAEMCETPYPVNWVLADPNEADTQCMVTWSLPMGPYEISYDDGEADNYFAWVQFGGAVSVKFTPAGYPATVVGGRLYVGDGSYPVGSNFIGSPMAVGVIAADGPSGFPGTVIDSVVVTVDQYGWITFGGFSYTIESGNFYLAMWQLTTPPNSPPIGIDTDVPTVYRSYTKQAGQEWKVSTYQDFMMRATVFGPGQNVMMAPEGAMVYPPKPVDLQGISQVAATGIPGTEKIGEFTPLADMAAADRDLVNYSIAFVDNFNPDAGETPMDGDLTILNNSVTNNYYNYTGWGAQDPGFYAFAVKANYESDESVWAYSNVAAHLLDNVATFNVTLCDGEDPSGASLVLQGMNYPYQHLTATTDASGVIVFDSVINGKYNLVVNKFGYQSYIYNGFYIMDDYQLDVVLEQVTFPPRNLYVDPLTSIATWDAPIYVQVPLQTFEDPIFPPAGWMKTSSGAGWFRTDNGSSASWTIPSGDGFYACANDDANSGNNGANDYLITPQLNLTATADYNMYFYSFFSGAWGQSAFVEYSTDGGATWEEYSSIAPAASWTNLELDLTDLSGPDGLSSVWFAMHSDDNGGWGSGWAVDNIEISDGAVETVQGYQVFLDGGYVAETAADVREYGYKDLQYGQTYTAAVAALYCTLSEKVYYTWTSNYLYPPRNLDDAYVYNTNEVPLMWNPPMTGNGVPMSNSTTLDLTNSGFEPFTPTTTGVASFISLGDNSRNVDVIACEEGSVWGNALDSPNNGYTSYDAAGYLCYQQFLGATGNIGSVTFWIVYTASPSNPRDFEVIFYENNGGSVGAEVYGLVANVEGILTDETAIGFAIWQYTVELPESVSLVDGFVSVQGIGGTSTTYWANTFDPAATGIAIQNTLQLPEKLAVCLGGASGPNPGGDVPPGLLSFNVYQDGSLVGNVPYADQDVDEWVYYVHNPVMPGTYMYDVTAVYDLGAYGFPGQSGESMMEGPDTVKVVWGFDIPFMETWSQGTFDFNSWTTATSNWKINSQIGNPEPSAEFTWDPAPAGEYALSLTSAPLNADMMTEGKIYFEYEVKLNDRNMTGTESLKVEVYNGQEWSQVGTYANNGSFDWTFSKLDITQYAMGRVFQVRFTATGVNSFDVISWFVDNIYIYRMCDTPTKLEGHEYDLANGENGAMIKWNAPELPAPPQGWIHWDDGTNFSGIGLDADAAFSVAARWAANTFPEYAGTSVTKVKVFAQDAGYTGWTIKIWSGANASTLLYSQNVTTQIVVGAWTEITLTTPVPYDITKELWVGYTVDGLNGMFPAGTDDGPAVVGFGDKVSLDGAVWEDLSSYGLNYNWNVEAYVEVVSGASASIAPVVDNTVYSDKAMMLKRGAMKEEGVAVDNSSTRAFSHFNIYRMAEGQTDYTLLAEVSWVEGQEVYEYYDNVTSTPKTYCYKVTAVWESATDYCESAPAPAKLAPMDDYVCFLVTDVSDPNAEGVFSLYPNPANDRVNITSSQAMTDITVYNYVGQVVFRSDLSKANSLTLNTGNYEAGVYVVRINTEEGVVTRRVTITR